MRRPQIGIDDLVAVVGLGLVGWGLALIYIPAALIAVGAALIALALWRL